MRHSRIQEPRKKITDKFLQIVTWNANGYAQKLELFLNTKHIDAHFIDKRYIRIRGYFVCYTNHSDGKARVGPIK